MSVRTPEVVSSQPKSDLSASHTRKWALWFAGIAVAILAPLAASLIQMAISRVREFEADRGGAEISGDPRALASALEKIHRYAQGIPLQATEAHPETAQMMIMNPLSGDGLRSLFSTHPATEERVARLMAMV